MIYPSAVLLEPDIRYVPEQAPTLPDAPLLALVLHDFETSYWGYKPRMLTAEWAGKTTQGYPETCRLKSESGKGTPFTEALQWHSFNLCMMSQYGFVYNSAGWWALTNDQRRKAVSEWSTYTDSKRFLLNHAGTDERANFVAAKILKEPLKTGLPLVQNVVTGGNVVKLLRHEPDYFQGEPYFEIEVWDGKDLSIDRSTHPSAWELADRHLIHLATNITPFGYDGSLSAAGPWKVDPFPFFSGRGSPYPVLSGERQWIAANRVRLLAVGEAWGSPYVP